MPKFPSSSQTQVKFLNLDSTELAVSVDGQQPFNIHAFEASFTPHKITSIFDFLINFDLLFYLLLFLFQASGEYMTFDTDSFTVSVAGGIPVTAHFLKGARQSVLINASGIQKTVSAQLICIVIGYISLLENTLIK